MAVRVLVFSEVQSRVLCKQNVWVDVCSYQILDLVQGSLEEFITVDYTRIVNHDRVLTSIEQMRIVLSLGLFQVERNDPSFNVWVGSRCFSNSLLHLFLVARN